MATLYNSPPFQYVNAIRVQDGREPVGDQYRDRVSAHGDIPNGLADFFLRQRIKRRGSFVEHQQLRPAQKSARDREPLLFSSRNLHPAFAYLRVEPVVGAQEHTFDSGLAEEFEELYVLGVRAHELQVRATGAGKQLRVLRHESTSLTQIFNRHLIFV